MSDNSQKFSVSLTNNVPGANISSGLSLMGGTPSTLDAHNADAKIFFLETCRESRKLEDVCFTNYIPARFLLSKGSLEANLCGLCNDPSMLGQNVTSIKLSRNNGARIKKIVDNVLRKCDTKDYYSNFIYETYVNVGESFDQRGKFRAFMIYLDRKPNSEEDEEHWLVVFLFDPFHLVCPVGRGNESVEAAMRREYHHDENYSENFGDVFEEELKSVDFKGISILS